MPDVSHVYPYLMGAPRQQGEVAPCGAAVLLGHVVERHRGLAVAADAADDDRLPFPCDGGVYPTRLRFGDPFADSTVYLADGLCRRECRVGILCDDDAARSLAVEAVDASEGQPPSVRREQV